MYLIVPLTGKGTDRDPFRPNLPTCNVLAVDFDKRECLVDIPDDVLPVDLLRGHQLDTLTALDPRTISAPDGELRRTGVMDADETIDVVASIPQGLADSWRRHMDKRYLQHKGRYQEVRVT